MCGGVEEEKRVRWRKMGGGDGEYLNYILRGVAFLFTRRAIFKDSLNGVQRGRIGMFYFRFLFSFQNRPLGGNREHYYCKVGHLFLYLNFI